MINPGEKTVIAGTESWHDTFVNLMLLTAGALAAGVMAALGSALGKLGIFADEDPPEPAA